MIHSIMLISMVSSYKARWSGEFYYNASQSPRFNAQTIMINLVYNSFSLSFKDARPTPYSTPLPLEQPEPQQG